MKPEEWESLGAQTSGLTEDLFVPIAAANIEAIESYVGSIQARVPGRKRPIIAVVVVAPQPNRNRLVPLWAQREADEYYRRLHPQKQLWVHVDYTNYRQAWKRLAMGPLAPGQVLDHIRNRAAERLTGYKHPFLRLCPISRETNTSGGLDSGAEGLEKIEWRKLDNQRADVREAMESTMDTPVILADPIDLTKMLDIPPGLSALAGVGSILMKYYAKTE